MQMRGYVALGVNYGYEPDLSKLSQEDLDVAKENIALGTRPSALWCSRAPSPA